MLTGRFAARSFPPTLSEDRPAAQLQRHSVMSRAAGSADAGTLRVPQSDVDSLAYPGYTYVVRSEPDACLFPVPMEISIMALIQVGGGVSVISGKIGGWVFARGPSGPYIRNFVIPIDPNSARQQVVRFAVAQLSTRWTEVLTDAQRAAWATYAGNVQLPNRLGAMRNISALAMYTRCNVPRLTCVAPVTGVEDDAPAIFDIGTYTAPAIGTVSESADTVSWGFTATDDWAIEVGGAMYVFASRPQNPTINYFDGPYRACGTIPGAVSPPTSPQVINLPFPIEAGQKVFFRCNVTLPDGRLASSFRGSGVGE